jgi:hypothetical protein
VGHAARAPHSESDPAGDGSHSYAAALLALGRRRAFETTPTALTLCRAGKAMSGALAIISVVGTVGGTSAIVGSAVAALFAERSKRAEWKHLRRVQFDGQLLEAVIRLSHETSSIHDRLRYQLPTGATTATRQIVAHSLGWGAFTEAATRVRLLCPAVRGQLQQVQMALFALVTLCATNPPAPEEQVVHASSAILGFLQAFEEAIRVHLGIPSENNRG